VDPGLALSPEWTLEEMEILEDGIHWAPDMAKEIFKNWLDQLEI